MVMIVMIVLVLMTVQARTAAAAARRFHGTIHEVAEGRTGNGDYTDNDNSCHYEPFLLKSLIIIFDRPVKSSKKSGGINGPPAGS
jgi:hypothetical protein